MKYSVLTSSMIGDIHGRVENFEIISSTVICEKYAAITSQIYLHTQKSEW